MKQAIFSLFVLLLFTIACDTPVSDSSTNSLVKEELPKDTLPVQVPVEEKPAVKVLDYDSSQWIDIAFLDTSIQIDMRYATTNNFVEEQLYDCGRCFLRPEAAKALVEAQQAFQEGGYRLKMLDCFRPRPIQQKLWDKFQNPSYVTPPSKGSMHNRGLAVDLTLVDADGKQLDMGTSFDYFGKEAHHTFLEHPKEVLANRQLLKTTMEAYGFKSIRTEWWHYSYTKAKHELSDMLWNCPQE